MSHRLYAYFNASAYGKCCNRKGNIWNWKNKAQGDQRGYNYRKEYDYQRVGGEHMMQFIAGAMLGGTVGVLVMCFCIVAGKADVN